MVFQTAVEVARKRKDCAQSFYHPCFDLLCMTRIFSSQFRNMHFKLFISYPFKAQSECKYDNLIIEILMRKINKNSIPIDLFSNTLFSIPKFKKTWLWNLSHIMRCYQNRFSSSSFYLCSQKTAMVTKNDAQMQKDI